MKLQAILLLTSFCLSLMSLGEDLPKENSPKFQKISEDTYQLGDITFHSSTREIRFPAVLNMAEGFLEFLIVHEHGAVHEALFRTHISPSHLNVALALLKYKASKELHIPPQEGTSPPKDFAPSEEVKKSSRIRIDVEFEKNGKILRIPTNQWVHHDTTQKAMPPAPWIYGGSDFFDGKFIAESTGEIVTIYAKDSSLINYSGEDHGNDTVWTVMSKEVPALETKVTIIFAPYEAP